MDLNQNSNDEPLHLIIDTDFGLDDICAILYLFYEMYTNKKVVIHHISLCQGQQLNTLNGVKQLFSMLKYCNIPVSKYSASNSDKITLSYGRDLKSFPLKYLSSEELNNFNATIDKLYENISQKDSTSDRCHLFTEGDWYPLCYNAQNYFCQEVNIPFDENFTRELDYEIIKTNAADALIELVNQKPNYYTLFAIGPLTNISDVLLKDEKWFTKLKGAYFMAGNFICEGNSPNIVSEWNLYADPWGARHTFDHLAKDPFDLKNPESSKICRILGLEVANMDVFPETKQAIALQEGKAAIHHKSNLSTDELPDNWDILERISSVLNRVMTYHPSACSFDVVASMSMTRDDVVYEYHRLQCSIDRHSPREGECVVFVKDEEFGIDTKDSIDVQKKQYQYQRTITQSNIQGTDWEELQFGAIVDIGIKINKENFQKVIAHMLKCDLIPETFS